jgi:hypothetical protein
MEASEALANEKPSTPPIIRMIPNTISSILILVGEISPYPTVVIDVIT